MITTSLSSPRTLSDDTARRALVESPDWRWGYRLVGDPLLRADDKFLTTFHGRAHGLAELVGCLTDARARAEIVARAERKERDLAGQLAELRARGLTELAREAEGELADQRRLLAAIADEESN